MASGKKQRFPTWWQGLIIAVSGVALGFSSCAAALAGYGKPGGLEGLFVVGFLAGLALLLAGFILFLIGVARAIVNALRAPAPAPGFRPTGAVPEARGTAVSSHEESPEQRILRHFQMVLVVFILLPLTSVATSVLVFMARPNLWPSITLILVAYVLSQLPYGFALARTRRGPDRLGIAIAFAAACTATVEGWLPMVHGPGMFSTRTGPFAWPSLFLLGHVVVAIFAWRAGKLAPPEAGDAALIAGSFAGVVVYLVVVRYLEMSLLPLYVNALHLR